MASVLKQSGEHVERQKWGVTLYFFCDVGNRVDWCDNEAFFCCACCMLLRSVDSKIEKLNTGIILNSDLLFAKRVQ